MSVKERIVFLDRAGLGGGDLPIPGFDHNWSEYPASEAADLVPRLFCHHRDYPCLPRGRC
jgi:glycerate dehydrogenase